MGYRCSRCGEWHDELPFVEQREGITVARVQAIAGQLLHGS